MFLEPKHQHTQKNEYINSDPAKIIATTDAFARIMKGFILMKRLLQQFKRIKTVV